MPKSQYSNQRMSTYKTSVRFGGFDMDSPKFGYCIASELYNFAM